MTDTDKCFICRPLLVHGTIYWMCNGCGSMWRGCWPDERKYILDNDLLADGGPIIVPNNIVAVPLDYNLEVK